MIASWSLCLLTAACAGRTLEDLPRPDGDVGRPLEDPPEVDTPVRDEQPPPGDAPAVDLPALPRQPLPELTVAAEEACSKAAQGTRATPTEADFRQLLVGSWLLCDSISAFGTTNEVGLIVHGDFTWQKLFRDADGKLFASSAWEESGTWETLDTSLMNGLGVYQLNMNIDGSGTVITVPVFAAEPELMRLDNYGVFIADYARL